MSFISFHFSYTSFLFHSGWQSSPSFDSRISDGSFQNKKVFGRKKAKAAGGKTEAWRGGKILSRPPRFGRFQLGAHCRRQIGRYVTVFFSFIKLGVLGILAVATISTYILRQIWRDSTWKLCSLKIRRISWSSWQPRSRGRVRPVRIRTRRKFPNKMRITNSSPESTPICDIWVNARWWPLNHHKPRLRHRGYQVVPPAWSWRRRNPRLDETRGEGSEQLCTQVNDGLASFLSSVTIMYHEFLMCSPSSLDVSPFPISISYSSVSPDSCLLPFVCFCLFCVVWTGSHGSSLFYWFYEFYLGFYILLLHIQP